MSVTQFCTCEDCLVAYAVLFKIIYNYPVRIFNSNNCVLYTNYTKKCKKVQYILDKKNKIIYN